MRVGVIGAGAVGAASLLSLVMRSPPACEIVVLAYFFARNSSFRSGPRADRFGPSPARIIAEFSGRQEVANRAAWKSQRASP
jgi:hypothetical protein